jgi:hypothetical protein
MDAARDHKPGGHLRLLLVEDDPMNVELFEAGLRVLLTPKHHPGTQEK